MEEERNVAVGARSSTDELPNEVAVATTAGGEGDVGGNQEKDGISSSSNRPGSTSPSPEEDRKNPLKNPVILQHFFQLCPVDIVSSCRLVCKLWYEESLLTWRTTFPLTLAMEENSIYLVQGYHYNLQEEPLQTPLQEFLEFNSSPENQCVLKPFRNIQIKECEFSLNPDEFKIFWKDIGSNLTTLDLLFCPFSSTEEFRQVIYKSCPVLQRLHICCCIFPTQTRGGREDHHLLEYMEPLYGEHKHLKSLSVNTRVSDENEKEVDFPISWLELLSHFPNLTFCDISCMSEFPEPEFETLIKAIKAIRKTDRKKLPFKRFQFYPTLEISQDPASHRSFALVKELHLPLIDCSIQVHPKLDQNFVKNTLRYLAPSLNTITIKGELDEKEGRLAIPTWFRDFPFEIQMKNLTTLESQGDLCGSFAVLKYAPNLSRLDISDAMPPTGTKRYASATSMVANTCMEELSNVEMRRLTTFNLSFLVGGKEVLHLFKWMPNITDLEMLFNDRLFALVCQNWKNLKKLRVFGNKVTGLTTEGITELKKGKKDKEVALRPNIANLEGLESLNFNAVTFTPEAIFHLFSHLPNLQSLHYTTGSVKREDVDITSYQRAVQDNVVVQWMKDYGTKSLQRPE